MDIIYCRDSIIRNTNVVAGGQNVTANITVPTTVAELSDAGNYATNTALDAFAVKVLTVVPFFWMVSVALFTVGMVGLLDKSL